MVSNQVEEGAVHRLDVLLGADEYVIEDEPLGDLLVAGYHLKLDIIQVLVWDAEVLLLPLVRLLVQLLLPPAVLAASHPHNQGDEAEIIEEHYSAICGLDGLPMVKQIY